MLESVALNTHTYMGGSPFDKDGLDTYQIPVHTSSFELCQLIVLRTVGDTSLLQLDILNGLQKDSAVLYSEKIPWRTSLEFENPVRLDNLFLGRLYLRLTALDGTQQNHCQVVLKGISLN